MSLVALLGTMLLAGLGSSLHCIGMCGPILLGLAPVVGRGDRAASGGRRLALDFAGYHLGRIWTYGLLGALAGAIGARIHAQGLALGWQRGLSVGFAGLVLLSGVLLLGLIPGLRIDRLAGACGLAPGGRLGSLAAMVRGRGFAARLLLGALLGLLPCGLVYAMLAVAASLADPLRGGLAMLAFGLGTVPSLSAVLVASNLIPARWRAQGARIAAVLLLAAGGFMLWRALAVAPGPAGCAHCHTLGVER